MRSMSGPQSCSRIESAFMSCASSTRVIASTRSSSIERQAARETEVAQEFPLHVAAAWIGNSQTIAAKHYLQVTDEHFRKAAQNPTQTAHENAVCDGQASGENPKTSYTDNAIPLSAIEQVAEAGLEPARGLHPRGF